MKEGRGLYLGPSLLPLFTEVTHGPSRAAPRLFSHQCLEEAVYDAEQDKPSRKSLSLQHPL
jgi:hypothetical protein